MSAATEALIAAVAAALPSSSPPASPLLPWSSPLLQIPSLLLPVPSPPLPLPSPPTYTIPTYAEAPLGYRAAMIRARAASPPTHHPSEIPSPPPFEVRESSAAAAARQVGHALTSSSDYGSIDTVDASIRASESRSMIVMGEVSIFTKERRYFHLMASSYEREAVDARRAWAHSKSRSQAMEAQIRAL
ncbi:hypothetical protein Tco_1362628 [Tanacetum coccineum]